MTQVVVVEDTARASPEAVFEVYTGHRGYANLIGRIRIAGLEQEGTAAPDGLGTVPKLRFPGAPVREQMAEYERPSSYSRPMPSGLLLEAFNCTVTVTHADEGTSVAYDVPVEGSLTARPGSSRRSRQLTSS